MSIRNIDDVCWPQAHSYLPYYRQLVSCVRAAAPAARLVLGGSAFTLMPAQFMDALCPDHGIAGEGAPISCNTAVVRSRLTASGIMFPAR